MKKLTSKDLNTRYYNLAWDLREGFKALLKDLRREKGIDVSELKEDIREDIEYLTECEGFLFNTSNNIKSGMVTCIDKLVKKLENYDIQKEIVKEVIIKLDHKLHMRKDCMIKHEFYNNNNNVILRAYSVLKTNHTSKLHKTPCKLLHELQISSKDLLEGYELVYNEIEDKVTNKPIDLKTITTHIKWNLIICSEVLSYIKEYNISWGVDELIKLNDYLSNNYEIIDSYQMYDILEDFENTL